MAVRTVERDSLVVQCSAELSRLIKQGEWPVGARIPNEQELARLLGVGRSTSREAVRSLIASGQLSSRQGSGTFVVSATPVSELDRRIQQSDIGDVAEVRLLLEVEAGRLAAHRRTQADLEQIKRALTARQSASSTADLIEADLRFHAAVVAATHNSVLVTLYESFAGTLRANSEAIFSSHDQWSAATVRRDEKAHADLYSAIERGDPRAAALVARRVMVCSVPGAPTG
ncbi:FadR family transcriptional regulator [Mycolicibacterium neworleansense]|uniref:GntR family transcriptional regulator n=1 Tax=Mycolicibacterium neworleansense TaxID=146018 RepID=A0A0H5RNZ1_9MYCO|nr:FadR family transcriptional regulator [Mycolicibacterium neworleansense]CRZ15880.1 GntR family transcriptional regulator [Mycolicibacterium neworleansense]